MDDRPGFWGSAPGILTGLAALVTAVTGLVLAFGDKSAKDTKPDVAATQPLVSAPKDVAVPASPIGTRFTTAATIEDPDGWTNLRASPSGAILRRIDRGVRFQTYQQADAWWRVRMADGVEGYVHRSRIRLIAG